MKVVVVKSPKILSGILKLIFGIKKEKEWFLLNGCQKVVIFLYLICYDTIDR